MGEGARGSGRRPLDDFFELGGDSFRAVRVMRELEERTGLQVPMYLVFEASGPRSSPRPSPSSGSDHPTGELPGRGGTGSPGARRPGAPRRRTAAGCPGRRRRAPPTVRSTSPVSP
ncbi:acyl carrier protein [Streptomyces sp. DHE7-1]|nr:acyl carrier protein [Streptomyces sp. DHE7-1]